MSEESSASTSGASSACPACGQDNVRLKSVDGILICDKCASKKFSSKVRKSIQEAFDKQQEQMRREAYQRRLQITKLAQENLLKGKIPEATQLYEKYVEILETRFKTSKQNLHPHLFDQKKDDQELLLATAVFWELSRIYDRHKGKDTDFRFYLKKYVEFSIGAPYMVLSAETLRRYVSTKKGVHVKDFEQAHTALRDKLGKCFIASVLYGPASREVQELQSFRDQWILKRPLGALFVKFYYATSPFVAIQLSKRPRLTRLCRHAFNIVALSTAKKITRKFLSNDSTNT